MCGTSRLSLLILLPVLVVGGCASSNDLTMQRQVVADQIREMDSLRALNRVIYEELGVLRDSLQFIDDIETGQYYRDMRSLQDRIRQLEFILHRQLVGHTVAELPADLLFEPASATLTSGGMALLDTIAVMLSEDFSGQLIRVEGHADNAPLGPSLVEKFGSNWGLSAARAASVSQYLIESREIDANRIAVVGYGSTRPVATADTPSARRQNRRVRVAALPVGQPTRTQATDGG